MQVACAPRTNFTLRSSKTDTGGGGSGDRTRVRRIGDPTEGGRGRSGEAGIGGSGEAGVGGSGGALRRSIYVYVEGWGRSIEIWIADRRETAAEDVGKETLPSPAEI